MKTLLKIIQYILALGILSVIGYMGYAFYFNQYERNTISSLSIVVICWSVVYLDTYIRKKKNKEEFKHTILTIVCTVIMTLACFHTVCYYKGYYDGKKAISAQMYCQ